MSNGLYDDFTTALQCLIEGLDKARNSAAPIMQNAVDKYAEAVETDAKNILNRPHWLLQRNISSKVKAYTKHHKIWAMVGFRFQNQNKRDPGYYGQFHEAGWANDRKLIKVPHHFLRQAKSRNKPKLDEDIQAALSDVMTQVYEIICARQLAQKK